ncbi:hypothetical protein AB1A64_18800 [Ruegeria sp. ANG10]|uniref:tetratricopeptide repeat protein n=1 Tax=Ruegeria sp. ANG10 TaxID=3042467 RepID=UPI003456E863
MSGRIVRLVAACLILIAAFVLYQQQKRNDLAADMLAGGCHSPEAAPETAIQGCNRLLQATKYKPEELAVLHIYRGRAYVKLENLQRALQDFEDAAAFNANEHRAWQWVSYVLGKLGQDEAAFDAIETAHHLTPANTYTMKQRFRLLRKLARYEEADAYFSHLMEEYPSAENERLLWIPRRLGKLRLELEQFGPAAEAYREALRVDLNHDETLFHFLESCRLAGSDCPPLFPERRADYPVLSCAEAIQEGSEVFPEYVEQEMYDSGYETRVELFENSDLDLRVVIQSAYLASVLEVLHRRDAEKARKLLVMSRVFECVNGGAFEFPVGQNKGDIQQQIFEFIFGPELTKNYIDLAHASLKTPPQQ